MIFYFSGTGNSEWVAKEVAKAQNETICFIPEVMQKKEFYYRVSEKEKIDSVLNEFSTKWKTDRLSRVALCASEIAVFEIMGGEVPPAVAVNEAIELVKKFDTDTSAKYINGVLGGYVRSKDVG